MLCNITEAIESSDVLCVLSDLVSMPSYESEDAIVEYISKRARDCHANYEITNVAPGRDNITLTVSNGTGKSLIFNTHMDTIPPSAISEWKTDPFKLESSSDMLYGLGSCDAKSSLSAMLVAFEALARNLHLINGRLTLQAVCCEETQARGTLKEVERGVSADAVIIGEPTNLFPMIGHKGGLSLKITTLGKSSHASIPQRGENAISKMANVICKLDELSKEINKRYDELLGNASLTVTTIHGGQATNVVPDRCVATIDRRLITGETVNSAIAEIMSITEGDTLIETMIGVDPCVISPEEPILKVVQDSIYQVTGEIREPSGFKACCDMWCFVQKLHVPTLILGPGELSQAHKANESVSMKQVCDAAKIYACIALNWLN